MKEKPAKLLLAITKSNWGGAQRYIYDLAEHFRNDKDFEVAVLAGGNGELMRRVEALGVRTIPFHDLKRDVGLFKDFKAALGLFFIFVREKPDILHVNSSKMGLFGAILGRCARVPKIVFTAHGWPFNEDRPRYQRMIFRSLAWITVLFSHKTIAVSQSTITSLRAPKFLNKKITRIYTGIETPKLYERGFFFEKNGIEKTDGVHIVSIGELHMSKGYDRALVALAACKNLSWTYHIMGIGDKEAYLKKLVKQLGIEDRVHFHGFVENASLYLNSFDLFLFPSRTEALGYVAVEALFSNLPMIASNKGGIPEVLFDDPYSKLIDCDNGRIFKETLMSMLLKLPVVDHTNRPGRMRFLPRFMFTATKKVYLN